MFHCCITVLVFLSSFTDSTEIVPAFRDSILQGNASAAIEMISEDAILMVDWVLSYDPQKISKDLIYFGLHIDIQEIEEMDGKQLLIEILSSPAVSGAIVLFGITPQVPMTYHERVFVPVEYGLFGERDTLYLEIVSEDGLWKILDYFETLPE